MCAARDKDGSKRKAKPVVLEAAETGDPARIGALLRVAARRGPTGVAAALAEEDDAGATALLVACKQGHTAVVNALLAHSADPTAPDGDEKRRGNALHYAAWGGHADLCELLVREHGCTLADRDVVGNTAILYAFYGGHRGAVDRLAARGCSVHEVNKKGHSALLQAACGGHMDLVRWLLSEHGFSVGDTDEDGNTALLFAAWGGHIELVQYLLAVGASPHQANNNGHSLFLSAANGGRAELIEWLLSPEARARFGMQFGLGDRNANGDTALLLACYGGHLSLVKRLVAMGASLDDVNSSRFTPLLSAANGGHVAVSEWLLEQGASIGEKDGDGYTPLILAACGGNVELVRFFLDRGASISERNDNGDTVLLLASYCGHVELVDWLLANGASLGETNQTGMGVLISAANGGSVDVCRLVLRRIAEEPDCADGIEHCDEGQYTPFLLAVQRGHLGVARMLAAYGADTARKTGMGFGAADLAEGDAEMTRFLERTAGWRPMQIAADAGMADRVHELILAGVPAGGGDWRGGTPHDIALSALSDPVEPGAPLNRDRCAAVVTEALLAAARRRWCPRWHLLFPRPHRQLVHRTFWLAKSLYAQAQSDDGAGRPSLPVLPLEIWHTIAGLLPRGAGDGGLDPSTVERQGWLTACGTPESRQAWRVQHLGLPGTVESVPLPPLALAAADGTSADAVALGGDADNARGWSYDGAPAGVSSGCDVDSEWTPPPNDGRPADSVSARKRVWGAADDGEEQVEHRAARALFVG